MAQVHLRKDGRYEARVQRDGRRFSVYGETEAETLAKLVELERRLAVDDAPPPGRLTVEGLVERWLTTEGPKWKPRTRHDYERLCGRFVFPQLGRVRLAKLTPDRLQRFLDGIPGRAASQTYRMLHRCFTLAVRWGYLSTNPCDRVTPPAYRPKPVDLPDAGALARLFHHCLASDDEYAPAIGVALLTGARLGELSALRWSDVDVAAGRIVIVRAGQRIRGVWTETEPKTRSGRRVIAVGETGVRLLRRQKAVVAQRRLRAGPAWEEYDLVFPATDGRPVGPDRVNAALRRLCREAGVPRLTPHQLRHCSASLALSAGVPLTDVSRRLGHGSVDITVRTYAHAIGNDQATAVAIEQALQG